MDDDSHRAIALKDFAATYGAAGLVKLRGLVLAALMVRQYGAAGYGAYTLGATIAQLIVVVATFGLGTAVVLRWPHIPEGARRRVIAQITSLSTMAVLVLVVGWLGALAVFPSLVEEAELRSVAALVAGSSFASIFTGLASNVYRAQGFMGRFSFGTTLRVAAELGVVVAAVVLALDLWVLAVWSVLSQTVVATVYSAYAYRSMPGREETPLAAHDAGSTRSILRLGGTLASASIAQDVVDRADRLVVAAILGTAAVGIYSAAYAVASAVYATLPPFTAVLLPRLRDPWIRDRVAAITRLHRYLHWFSLVTAVLGLGLVGLRRFAAEVAVGGDEAAVVASLTPLLVSAALMYVAARLTYLPMLLDDNAKGYARSVAQAAVANLVVSPIFTYFWGLEGTAGAALVSYLLLGILSVRQLPLGERGPTWIRSAPLIGAALLSLAA